MTTALMHLEFMELEELQERLFLTFFIRRSWMAEAAAANGGSWTIWNQLGIQALAVGIAIVFSAGMTFVIIYFLNKVSKV